MDPIKIVSFPLAPSANEAYFVTRYGKMAPTAIYRCFERACKKWRAGRPDTAEMIEHRLNAWLEIGLMIRVDAYFVFERGRLWTLDGRPQKLDANNRLKPALDGLVACLRIDDLYFWADHVEKVQCSFADQERTVFVLSPMRPRRDGELFAKLGLDSPDSWPPVLVEKPTYRRKKLKSKNRGRP